MSNDWGSTPEQLSKLQQTGGPAFPHSRLGSDCDGMTLRDWFAGLAMQQQVNNPLTVSNADSRSAIAERAYAMADEMLKARWAK